MLLLQFVTESATSPNCSRPQTVRPSPNCSVRPQTVHVPKLFNSAIEVGGVEAIPGNNESSLLRKLAESMYEEPLEEIKQGAATNLVAKTVYDKDAPWASMTDEDAVINPVRMAKEGTAAILPTAIMGGGMTTVSAISQHNAMKTAQKNYVEKEAVESGIDIEKPVGTVWGREQFGDVSLSVAPIFSAN